MRRRKVQELEGPGTPAMGGKGLSTAWDPCNPCEDGLR